MQTVRETSRAALERDVLPQGSGKLKQAEAELDAGLTPSIRSSPRLRSKRWWWTTNGSPRSMPPSRRDGPREPAAHPAREGTGRTLRNAAAADGQRVAELEAKVNRHLERMGFHGSEARLQADRGGDHSGGLEVVDDSRQWSDCVNGDGRSTRQNVAKSGGLRFTYYRTASDDLMITSIPR